MKNANSTESHAPASLTRGKIAFSIGLCLLPQLAGVFCLSSMPAQIPIHFNFQGTPDNWISSSLFFFGFPWMFVAADAFCLGTTFFSKKGSAQSPSIENLLLLTIPFIELLVYIGILLFMNTDAFRITTWISGLIGLLLVILGNLMPKARQNSYFGFQTQSTLSSKSVWQKTNRAAGYALTLLGVLTIFAAFTYNEVLMFALLIGGSLLVTMGLSIYAHRLADRESQKTE